LSIGSPQNSQLAVRRDGSRLHRALEGGRGFIKGQRRHVAEDRAEFDHSHVDVGLVRFRRVAEFCGVTFREGDDDVAYSGARGLYCSFYIFW